MCGHSEPETVHAYHCWCLVCICHNNYEHKIYAYALHNDKLNFCSSNFEFWFPVISSAPSEFQQSYCHLFKFQVLSTRRQGHSLSRVCGVCIMRRIWLLVSLYVSAGRVIAAWCVCDMRRHDSRKDSDMHTNYAVDFTVALPKNPSSLYCSDYDAFIFEQPKQNK